MAGPCCDGVALGLLTALMRAVRVQYSGRQAGFTISGSTPETSGPVRQPAATLVFVGARGSTAADTLDY
jgi:hypothetical protein